MNKKIWIPKLNYYSKRLSMWQEKFWKDVTGKPFMGIIDNVTGRRVFEFATFGRSGVQQSNSKLFRMTKHEVQIPITQEMTACCVWNASNAAAEVPPALTTQIDRGRRAYDGDSLGTWYGYGYGVHNEHYVNLGASFGVMDSSTYTDGSSTSRTIKGVVYYEPGGATYSDDLILSLDGTSISNSDTTWKDFTWDDIGGTPRTVSRSVDLTTYTASLNGSTHWRDLAAPYDWSDLDANTDFELTTS